MSKNYSHSAVMLNEAVKGLNIHPDGIYLDGTFGSGGHSRHILSKLSVKGRLFAIDRDPAAIMLANCINDYRFKIIHGTLSNMKKYIASKQLMGQVNGILLDLGVSSLQLSDPKRGFSFMHDGLLDMRMDNSRGRSAAQWLMHASEKDISWVLKTFGEERFAKRIARSIVTKRNHYRPITSTTELAALINNATPCYYRRKKIHPATRSFQAIRIYINNELEEIKQALNSVLTVLAPKGRLSIISFHSLEDRLVKYFIRQYSNPFNIPVNIPLTETQIFSQNQNNHMLKAIEKLRPSINEIKNNPRARSAILRVAEKYSFNE